MRLLAVTLSFFLLSGCPNESQVEQRGEFWNAAVQKFLSQGRTVDEINEWLVGNGAEPLTPSENVLDMLGVAGDPSDKPDQFYFARLEDIDLDGPVCASWHFSLKAWADEDGTILRHEVDAAGICL